MRKKRGKYCRNESWKLGELQPTSVYCTVGILMMAVLLMCFLLSHGDLLARYFFYDTRDTGMDFFHSIEYVRGRTPYELFGTLYPPLANLMFFVFYYLIPIWVSDKWPTDFSESVHMRGTNLDLRTYQAPMLLFLLFILVAAWIMVSLVVSVLKRLPYKRANTVAICLVLSPGMLLALERGNIIFLLVPLTLFFVKFRNSKNPVMRELALLSLAVAAGMKLYPAFFGVLLLRDKKYGQAFRAVIYGILSVVLPALFFKEGLAGIPLWLSVVFRFGSGGSMPWTGTGFAGILHQIARWIEALIHVEVDKTWFAMAGYGMAALLLLTALVMKKDWQSALAITMAMIMFQSQGQYIFGFVCIPLVMFFAEEKSLMKNNAIPFAAMMLPTVHLPLFYTRNESYPNIAAKQIFSAVLVVFCVVTALCIVFKKANNLSIWRKRNGNMEQ